MGGKQAEKGASSGRRRSPAQKAQQAKALAKGRASREAKRKEGLATNRDTAGERWAKLVKGEITVKDLDNEELKAMRVRGRDGVINKGRTYMPAALAHAFRAEFLSRITADIEDAAPDAVQVLKDIANDPEEPAAARVKAATLILERALGRTPQEVHVSASGFDQIAHEVVQGVVIEREDLSA
jgi:hypothetical protein